MSMEVKQLYQSIQKKIKDHSSLNSEGMYNSSRGKDIIIFLGNTGAGKTTVVNFLNNIPMSVNQDDEIQLENPNNFQCLKIGMGGKSETELPQSVQMGDFVFYDLPGFLDNRGAATNLLNASFIKNIIEQANSVRLVLVTGEDEITGSHGETFKNLLKTIKDLCPQTKSLEKSCLLVVTKSLKDNSEDLIKFLERKIEQSEDLQIWLHPERIQPMSRRIDSHQRYMLLLKIFSLTPIKIQFVLIETIYSPDLRNDLRYLFQFEMMLLLEKIVSQYSLSQTNIEQIELALSYFEYCFERDISLEVKNSKLIMLLSPLSDVIYFQEEDRLVKTVQQKIQLHLSLLNETKIKLEKDENQHRHLTCLQNERQNIIKLRKKISLQKQHGEMRERERQSEQEIRLLQYQDQQRETTRLQQELNYFKKTKY